MKKTEVHILLVLMVCSLVLVVPAASAVLEKIAFASNRDNGAEIYIMNPDGTDPTRLTTNDYHAGDTSPSWSPLAFSPSGTKIAFASTRDHHNIGDPPGNLGEIYTMNADGLEQKYLTYNFEIDENPAWSPDGTRIAFDRFEQGEGDKGAIYVINPDGSNEKRLTPMDNQGGDYDPTWSPDSTKIAFVSHRDDHPSKNQIYIMNADGSGEPNRVTINLGDDASPAWSPDGTKIAFSSTRNGNKDIYVINVDGNKETRLTTNPAFDSNPTWSPDGTKIAFATNRDGEYNWEIYVMNADDGSEQTNLTKNPAIDGEPAWAIIDLQTINIYKEGTGSNQIGDSINLYGMNTYSPVTYLILIGPNIDASGGTLTDLSAKASQGHFTTVDTTSGGNWAYTWDTNAILGGILDPGSYTIYAMDSPDVLSHLADHKFAMLSIALTKGEHTPVAKAGADQTVIVNEIVKLDGSGSTDSDGTIVTYTWDFGDTKTGSGKTTSHTYTAAGTYTVTLIVTDNEGLTGSDTSVSTVKTPGKAAEDLSDEVTGLGLPKGIEQGLLAKLDTAEKKITQKQYTPARNTLNAFINQVNAQRGKALTGTQANELIAIAQRIINSIPGK